MIWRALFTYLHLLAAGLAAGLLLGQHWLLKRPVDRTQLGLLQNRRQLLSHRIQLCRALGGTWTSRLAPPKRGGESQ